MRPPQTTVVKKSQLQKDSTILLQLLKNNKDVYQHNQKQYQACNGNLQQQQKQSKQLQEKSSHLQSYNKHLQIGRQEEQLRQLPCRQELQQQWQQNENLQHQKQKQHHNGILEQQPVLKSYRRRQQQNNSKLNRRQQLKPISQRQQQKINANLKKQLLQQNQKKEELKWQQNQKDLNKRKKQLQECSIEQQRNRHFSQGPQPILSKHKQQQQQIEELHRRPEQLWPQQQYQHNSYLQERIFAPPPHQEQHYHQVLQHEHLQSHCNRNLEKCIQSPHQQQYHHQQFQREDLQHKQQYNEDLQRKQQQYNKDLLREKEYQQLEFQKQQYYNQQLQQQNENLQQLQIHTSNNVNLEHAQLSHELQQEQKVLEENKFLNHQSKKQQQPESQTSSPIPYEEEHLIMCGYVTFESCANNFSYSCNFCSKNLENLYAFSEHLIQLHSNEIENEINSKVSNKVDTMITKDNLKEINIEKQKCGIISISSKLYNLLLNADFKFDCNFCDKKFEAINKFSEHIGKKHLDLLENDKANDMEFEDDIEIDPSCILSFDEIDEINEFDLNENSTTTSNNNNNNNHNNEKIVMSVPISDNSEIFMTIDIDENDKNNINDNNNSNLNNSCYNKEKIQEEDIPMEIDSLEKPKLRVNIKHKHTWATRYFS